MEKKSSFKKFLATASTLAVIAGASTSAMGAVVATDNAANPAFVGDGTGLATGWDANFAGGVDTLQLDHAVGITTSGALNLGVGAININGNANQLFTVNHAVIYGAGVDLAMALTVNAGGSITIRDVTDVADTVTVTGGTLTMQDAAENLVVTGGIVAGVRDVVGDVTVDTGTVTQTGIVGGTLGVVNGGLYLGAVGADVTDVVTINTANAGINTLNDSNAGVALVAGNLTMNDATTAGNVTVTNGALIMHDTTFGNLLVNGGTATIRNAVANVAVDAGTVTQTGTVGGTLGVVNGGLYLGAVGADVTAVVTINTANAGINTLNDSNAGVALVAGNLTMNDATTAGNVTVTNGALIMHDTTFGNLLVNGGTATIRNAVANVAVDAGTVTQTGTVGGTLSVVNGGLYLGAVGADVTGVVTINTANAEINTLHNAADNVILTKGKLTMTDATGGGALVTVTDGELIMHDAAHDVTVNGGTATINDIARDLTVTKGTVVANDVANDVTVDGANTPTVTLNSVGNDVTLVNAGELSVATKIDGKVEGAGILTLTGDGEVTGAVGTGILNVTKIVAKANRTFANVGLNLTELAIEGSSKVTFTLADLAATNVTTTETNRLQNIVINEDQTITGNIGTAANSIGAVIANANKIIKVQTLEFNASVKTETADQATVEFTLANAKAISLGDSAKQLLKVDFQENASVSDGVYAAEVQIANDKTATLGGTIKSANFHLDTDDSKVIFAENATVDSVIKSTGAGKGLVEFAGNAIITQNLGEAVNTLKKVTFADDATKTAKLGASVFATDIELKKSVVELTSNATLTGLVSVNASILDLSDKTLTIVGNTTIQGKNTIKFAIDNNAAALVGGNIVMNGDLAFEAGAELVLAPQDQAAARPTGGATRTFEFLKNAGKLVVGKELAADKLTVTPNNPFIKWTTSAGDNGGIILTQVDNAAAELKNILGAKADTIDNANIDALTSADQGTDAAKVVDLLATFAQAGNTDKIDETFDRLVSQTVVTDAIESVATSVSSALGARTASLAGNQGVPVETRTVSSEHITGVSAGDEHARFGAWFSPFFSKTTQKARKGAAGYKDESYGASFGFDTRANDDMIIGAAITASNTELKHKDFKSGDKTKINSLLFSIYGMQQITDTWFALGSATFGTNEVKKSERKVSGATSYEVANAKYTSMSFTGEAMFGYNYITEQATITPMAGLRYSRVNDAGYKESGTEFQNLDVSTKASNKFEVIVGARATGGTFDLNGLTITPEIHGFINHDLINKNPKQELKLGGTTLTGKSSKPVRTTYNLGLGANAEYGMMEYGASYDANLANKRVGHQGTLRLRVNF